ncbi:MAG: PAS domain S-box protein, partial [Thermoleophilaceae bacterium]|nr:PAS domain S-box protein [Thermoleophilaceae bacterium]
VTLLLIVIALVAARRVDAIEAQRLRSQELTKQAEERFRMLSTQAPVGIFETDAAGACRFVNDRWQMLTGLSSEEAMDDGWLGALHPDDRDLVATAWSAAIAGDREFDLAYRFRRPDGSVAWVEGIARSVHGPSGDVTGYLGTCADVTARRQMEGDLRRGNRYFELSRDLLCTASFEGYFTQLNAGWTRVLGWSEEELRARPFVEFVHPDDVAATVEKTADIGTGGDVIDFVNRYQTKDGGWRWFEWNAVADQAEETIYASARDITDRIFGEQALETSERQTRQILETANDAFVAMDAAGLVIDWNRQAELIFGWPLADAIGRELADTILPERYREPHRVGLKRFVAGGEARAIGKTLELDALHRDGREFPIELTISPLET